MTTIEEKERIRDALVHANATTNSYKVLHKIIEQSGLTLHIKSDALSKFATGQTKNLTDDEDYKALRKFLYATQVGRVLRASSQGWRSTFDRVIESLQVHLPSDRAQRVNGHFFCFHGAIADARHFTVRLLKVERESDGVVSIISTMRSQPTSDPGEIYRSEGFLVYDQEQFQLLMLHEDDLTALNLIVPSKTFPPRQGQLKSLWGHMLGLTAENHWFCRAIMIDRIPKDMSAEEATLLTGNYTKDKLPPNFLTIFKESR